MHNDPYALTRYNADYGEGKSDEQVVNTNLPKRGLPVDRSASAYTIPRHRRGNSSGPLSVVFQLNMEEDNPPKDAQLTYRNGEHSRHSSRDSELKVILANAPNSPRTAVNLSGLNTLTKSQVQLAISSIIGFEGNNSLSISLFKTHLRTGDALFISEVQANQQPSDGIGEEELYKLYHDVFLDAIEQGLVLQEVDIRDSASVFRIITNRVKKDLKSEENIFFEYVKNRPELSNVDEDKINVYAAALEETLKRLCDDFFEYKILADRLRTMIDIKADQGSVWTKINPFIAAALGAVPLSQVQINSNDNNDISYQFIQNFCLAFFTLGSTMLSYCTRKLEMSTKDWEYKYAKFHILINKMYEKKICWFVPTADGNEEVRWDQTTEKFDFAQTIFMRTFMLLKKNNYLQYDKMDEEFALNLLGALLNRFLSRVISSNIAHKVKPKTLDDAENIANIIYKSYAERLEKLNYLTRQFSSIHPPSESGLRNHIISYFRLNKSAEDKNALIKSFPEDDEKEEKEQISGHRSRPKERGDIYEMPRQMGNSVERRRRSVSPALAEQIVGAKLLSPRRKKSDSDLEVVNNVETLLEIRSKMLSNYLSTAWYAGIDSDNKHYNVMNSLARNILGNRESKNLYLAYIPIALTANYINGLSLLGLVSNAFTTVPYTALCMAFSIVSILINNYLLEPYLERIEDNRKCYLEFESTLKALLMHDDILSLNEKVYSPNTLVAQSSQRTLETDVAPKEIFNTSSVLHNVNTIVAETFVKICSAPNSKVSFLYRHQQASLAMSLYSTLCQTILSNDNDLKLFLCNMTKEQAKMTGEVIAKSLIDEGTIQECKINVLLKMMPCCKMASYYLKINDFDKDSFVDALRKMANKKDERIERRV